MPASPWSSAALVACGAGPLTAVIMFRWAAGFLPGVLLKPSWPPVAAMAVSAIAASVAWLGLGAEPYEVAHFPYRGPDAGRW
jgi:hypothetical protein